MQGGTGEDTTVHAQGKAGCPDFTQAQQALRLHLRLWSKDLTHRAATHNFAPQAALGEESSLRAKCTLPHDDVCIRGSEVAADFSCSCAESMSESSDCSCLCLRARAAASTSSASSSRAEV